MDWGNAKATIGTTGNSSERPRGRRQQRRTLGTWHRSPALAVLLGDQARARSDPRHRWTRPGRHAARPGSAFGPLRLTFLLPVARRGASEVRRLDERVRPAPALQRVPLALLPPDPRRPR